MVTTRARDVSCEQAVPSLPPMSLAGRVGAVALSEKCLRKVLLAPDELVRPCGDWPRTFKQARIRAKPVESPRALGILFTSEPDKNKRQEPRTKALRAESGDKVLVRPALQRMADFVSLVRTCLSTKHPKLKHWEITGSAGISDLASVSVLPLPPMQRWILAASDLQVQDVLHPRSASKCREGEGRRLACGYRSYAAHREGDIRLEAKPAAIQGRPPRQAVSVDQWHWRTVLQAVWEQPEHINSPEGRTYVLALKGGSRNSSEEGRAFWHVKYSQVGWSALLEHLSPAHALSFLTQRAATLGLAADIQPLVGLVRNLRNPADKPSRRRWLPQAAPRESIDARCGGSTQ